jgi:hypothetical protein
MTGTVTMKEEVGEEAALARRVRRTVTLTGGPSSSATSRRTSDVISMGVMT